MLYTVEQAAELLSLHPNAVERLIRRGTIPHIDVSVVVPSRRPRRRIHEGDLLAFIESRRVKQGPKVSPRERMRRRRAAVRQT